MTGKVVAEKRSVPSQVMAPEDTRSDVSAHGFWKRGATALFDVCIINLYAGSYMCMIPEKAIAKAE